VGRALRGWDASAAPLYVALADALGRAIQLGTVSERLPSERTLAAELHVSRSTIALAYETLHKRALVERERGSGTVALTGRPHHICPDPLACVQSFFEGSGVAPRQVVLDDSL
jgi:DNA-binding GntR family transcriptional regulator